MIKNIFAFRNFNVACTDENGQQVVSEQGKNLLVEKLKDMLKRKVITPNTVVYSEYAIEYPLTVREILDIPVRKVRRS